jgi:hypothetical protein
MAIDHHPHGHNKSSHPCKKDKADAITPLKEVIISKFNGRHNKGIEIEL